MMIKSRGFTLIEVLVALFVVAIALSASMRALSVVTQTGISLPSREVAQLSADNMLAEASMASNWPALGQSEMDCSQGEWHLTCQLMVTMTPNPSIRRLEVVVRQSEETTVLASVVTLIANRGGHVL